MVLRSVGISCPDRFWRVGVPERRALLERAADLDLDHVFFADHVSFKVGMGQDGMVQAAGLSQLHPTLGVYLGVYLLALRHPVTVARQLASLSEFAPGRITFGVGVGGEDRNEIAMCGVDPATRGKRTDECLQIVRSLLTGEKVDFDGRFYQLDQAHIVPAPDPAIPITIGGRSDAALTRTATYGDGWLATWNSVRRFAEGVDRIGEEAAALGRNATFSHGYQTWCGVGPDAASARPWVQKRMEQFYQVPFEAFEKYTPFGTPADIAEFMAPYVEAGCEHLNMTPYAETPEEAMEGMAEVKQLLLST